MKQLSALLITFVSILIGCQSVPDGWEDGRVVPQDVMDAAIERVHDAGKWDSDCWDVEVRYRWLDEIGWASSDNPDYSVGVTDADDTEDGPFLVSLRKGRTRPTTLEHELVHIHLACSRRDLYENWNHLGDEWKGMNR